MEEKPKKKVSNRKKIVDRELEDIEKEEPEKIVITRERKIRRKINRDLGGYPYFRQFICKNCDWFVMLKDGKCALCNSENIKIHDTGILDECERCRYTPPILTGRPSSKTCHECHDGDEIFPVPDHIVDSKKKQKIKQDK